MILDNRAVDQRSRHDVRVDCSERGHKHYWYVCPVQVTIHGLELMCSKCHHM